MPDKPVVGVASWSTAYLLLAEALDAELWTIPDSSRLCAGSVTTETGEGRRRCSASLPGRPPRG